MALPSSIASLNPFLVIKEIKDQYIRRNFENLSKYFTDQNQLLDFKFFEVQLAGATESYTLNHSLGYIPRDILVSFFSGSGDVTFNLEKATPQTLNIASTGPAYVRFYLGTYWQNRGVNNAPGSMILRGEGTVDGTIPTGTVLTFAGSIIPPGYLLCDGTAYMQAEYANLFSIIGITHGQGKQGTFCVPDYRGRFLRGVSGNSTNDPDKTTRTAMNTGGNTGNEVGSVQADQLRSHTHGVFGANFLRGSDTTLQSVGSGATIQSAASGGNETRPINAYVNFIIKT